MEQLNDKIDQLELDSHLGIITPAIAAEELDNLVISTFTTNTPEKTPENEHEAPTLEKEAPEKKAKAPTKEKEVNIKSEILECCDKAKQVEYRYSYTI